MIRLSNELCIVFSSALLLHLALVWPAYCGWFVFLFLLPIAYQTLKDKFLSFDFKTGFIWGICFFFFHGFSYWLMILEHGYGLVRVLFIVAVISYGALLSGLWFFVANRLPFWLGWGGFTFGYFYYIDCWFMLPCGMPGGYSLCFPILALMEYPQIVMFVRYIGRYGLLACLICCSLNGARSLVYKSKKNMLWTGLFALPFVFGCILQRDDQIIPPYVFQIGVPCLSTKAIQNPLDAAQHIAVSMQELLRTNKNLRYIITPESSYPFALNECQDLLFLLRENGITDTIFLFLGAHRREGECLFNSLFLIERGRIIFFYDKSLLLPFTEKIPPILKSLTQIQNLIFSEKEPFSSLCLQKKTCFLDSLRITPYICSDLFLGNNDCSDGSIILVIINERWFKYSYIQRLMLFHARLMALQWGKEIIYVGYQTTVWISSNGMQINLYRC